jgi:gliding motility-associated-like protein
VGSYPITVSGASDPDYTIAYAGGTLTINKAPQTIDFTTIPDQTINSKYDLSPVNASSGLPVSFALTDPTIAMISGSTLTSLQVGTETLTASQAGDDNYLPATNVSQTFNIIDDSGNDIIVNQVVSPNGDGIDDVLNIKNIENYPKNKLALVNRDGIMIYEANGYNNTTTAFDGHSNITGALQQQGTLLYILEYWANGQYHRKTGFTVLRY